MAKLKEAALAAAREIAAEPAGWEPGVGRLAVIVETHMRSLLEQATDVARLWAVVRGDQESRQAAAELARELRHVMEGA